jgi:3-phenylpropionate/trans-cinnamate dioxygenase ferredoxin reductase component
MREEESIMHNDDTVVIVGGGLAGASAAEAMRAEGFRGRIRLVSEERELPYLRPPLSKEYLLGRAPRDDGLVKPAEWYVDQDVELILGRRAAELSVGGRELVLQDGAVLPFGRVLLATGASPRRFPGRGADLPGVHQLRTITDAESLRDALRGGGRRVVVVGSGWIGLEVASAARRYGNAVTVLGRGTVPLAAQLGDEVGSVFAALHRANGVDLRMPTEILEIIGGASGVTGVALGGGEVVPADVVVVGIGAVPNVELARDAGLEVEDGIVTDAAFRSRGDIVYSVGDAASVFHPVLGQHLRVEHWANALKAGAAAGASIAGRPVSFDEIPYFYTDQFDLGMEYSGYGSLAAGAEVVFRGDPAAREFVAFWLREGSVVAGMNVNVWDVNETVQGLIRSRVRVDPRQLADESIPLDSLLGVSA